MGESQGMTVAQMARAAGVSPHTVRYYERLGILPLPPRDGASGYRRYPPEAADRLRLIRSLQGVGFTLGDIRGILRLTDAPDSCAAVQALAREKLAAIRTRVEELDRCAKALEAVIDLCAREGNPHCHLFDASYTHKGY